MNARHEDIAQLVRWLDDLRADDSAGRHIVIPDAEIRIEGWQHAPRLGRGKGSQLSYRGAAFIDAVTRGGPGAIYRIASEAPSSTGTPSFSFVAPFARWSAEGPGVTGSYGIPGKWTRYSLTRIEPLSTPYLIHRSYPSVRK